MPIVGFSLSSSQLVTRWRKRQHEILEKLPPDLLTEYRKLNDLIAEVTREEAKNRRERKETPKMAEEDIFPEYFAPTMRIPLSVHKKKLIDYLKNSQGASRGEI